MTILRLLTYLRLGDNAEDPAAALESIERNVVFRGTNLLILVFAIVIASVGLNVNSAAVIIGAMLISPLMGPIVGVGAGLGVLDLHLVRRSLKNLGFAVAASVLTSTLYFLLTPLDEAHSEILARTSPTIWDVLIALSGGFAGIIAAASKDRGNVVPGVAIATALMPPLCTAGYGLAHANWAFFAGAFYLFLINSVFIALATLATVRWLRYPARQHTDPATARRIRLYVTTAVLLTVVPSVYLAWRLVGQNTFSRRANQFIAAEAQIPENYLLAQKVDPQERRILLTYMGAGLDSTAEALLRERLLVHGLEDVELVVRTGLRWDEKDRAETSRNALVQQQLEEQRLLFDELRALRDSLRQDGSTREALLREARAVEPDLKWLVPMMVPGRHDTLPQLVSARFVHPPDTTQINRLDRWLSERMNGRAHELVIGVEGQLEPGQARKR